MYSQTNELIEKKIELKAIAIDTLVNYGEEFKVQIKYKNISKKTLALLVNYITPMYNINDLNKISNKENIISEIPFINLSNTKQAKIIKLSPENTFTCVYFIKNYSEIVSHPGSFTFIVVYFNKRQDLIDYNSELVTGHYGSNEFNINFR